MLEPQLAHIMHLFTRFEEGFPFPIRTQDQPPRLRDVSTETHNRTLYKDAATGILQADLCGLADVCLV